MIMIKLYNEFVNPYKIVVMGYMWWGVGVSDVLWAGVFKSLCNIL